jgi:fructan beta-fructosidase
MTSELYNETYRPQFHFTPRENWTNDPNGLVYYAGEYHLFFQHNPFGINWGNMTWGHAVSPDMVRWTQLPHALLPDRLGTMFSGSAVVDWENTAGFQQGDEKTLVAIYTAAGGTSDESKDQPFTQCIAYSTDRGRAWTKYAGNPVLPHIVKENRDPKVVWHAPTRRWVMALYLDGETYALFNSPDLKAWTRLQDIEMPGSTECPDFFEIAVEGSAGETRWVFTGANGRYLIGAFDGAKFTPEAGPLPMDHGANYYAVQTYSDIPAGRRVQIAWMNGGQYPGMPFNQQMSFPCDLKLRRTPEGLRVCRVPAPEIESLRAKAHAWSDVVLQPGDNLLADVSGDTFDIRAEFEVGEGGDFSFVLRGQPITYSAFTRQITSLGKSAQVAAVGGHIQLQVLLDRSSIEVFANDGLVSLTSCFVPDPANMTLQLSGKGVKVKSLNAYELKSSWR